jgi:membrane-associated phospholipid phosphatase
MNALSRIRSARDHNRGLAAPVRWAHLGWAAASDLASLGFRFVRAVDQPARKPLSWTILLILLAIAVFPLDGHISAWFERHRPRGDLRRELEALQQFGQFAMSMVVVAAVWLLDRPRARRLLDWLAGAVVCLVTINLLKALVGRPRPSLGDPYFATGPAGLYPVPVPSGFRMESPWTSGYDLASFPSRHACFAALAAVFLCRMAPTLRPLALMLAMMVASARVVMGAHYPSDVLVGAAIGYAIGVFATRGSWGVRAVDWGWKRFVDPFATPALPALQALDLRAEASSRP